MSAGPTDVDISNGEPDDGFSAAVVNCMRVMLENAGDGTYVEIQAITSARVPILKLTDGATGTECDICINQHFGVHNSLLLKTYSMVDARVRPLVLAVKHWAGQRGINNSSNGSLSSYAWVILTIRYLQQCKPPVLPNLQVGPAASALSPPTHTHTHP